MYLSHLYLYIPTQKCQITPWKHPNAEDCIQALIVVVANCQIKWPYFRNKTHRTLSRKASQSFLPLPTRPSAEYLLFIRILWGSCTRKHQQNAMHIVEGGDHCCGPGNLVGSWRVLCLMAVLSPAIYKYSGKWHLHHVMQEGETCQPQMFHRSVWLSQNSTGRKGSLPWEMQVQPYCSQTL